jgi:hypothetical protein
LLPALLTLWSTQTSIRQLVVEVQRLRVSQEKASANIAQVVTQVVTQLRGMENANGEVEKQKVAAEIFAGAVQS